MHKLNLAGQVSRRKKDNNNNVQTTESYSPRAKLAQLEEQQRQIRRQIREVKKQIRERESKVAERENRLAGKEKEPTSKSCEDLSCDSHEKLGTLISEQTNQASIAKKSFVEGVCKEDMEPIMISLLKLCGENLINYKPVNIDVTYILEFMGIDANKETKMCQQNIEGIREFLINKSLHARIVGVMAQEMLGAKYYVPLPDFILDFCTKKQKQVCANCEATIRVICSQARDIISHEFPNCFSEPKGDHEYNQRAIRALLKYVELRLSLVLKKIR